jgi:predicted permease
MSWFSRLLNTIRPERLDDELEAELNDHLARRAEELAAKGLQSEDANYQARLRFGNSTAIRENSRDTRLVSGLETLLQDVRYAFRGMRRSPIFVATALLSLSIAIGANTALYSLIDAAVLRPLPVPHPERLVTLAIPNLEGSGNSLPAGGESQSFSYPFYQTFLKAAGTAAELAVASFPGKSEVRDDSSTARRHRVNHQMLSGNAFQTFGITPAIGRLLSPIDDQHRGAVPFAVLSYDYWQQHYQADPQVIGRTLYFNPEDDSQSQPFEIIGVAQKGFFGTEPGRLVDVWTPVVMYHAKALEQEGWSFFRIVGRLANGVTPQELQQRLQPSFHAFAMATVERNPTMSASVTKQLAAMQIRVHFSPNGSSEFRNQFARPLWIVFGVAAGVLIIACSNIASLLLARSSARSTELAMRVSLGASRRRLLRQVLTENAVLAFLASIGGGMIAYLTTPLLVNALSTNDGPVQFVLGIDMRVLGFCAVITSAATLLFGLLPALQAGRVAPMEVLRKGSGQTAKLRMGRLFVGAQVAFAFSLVVLGAAFLFSLNKLVSVKPGFDAKSVAVLELTNESFSKPQQHALVQQLQARFAQLPGVDAVSAACWSIFGGSFWGEQVFFPEGRKSEREELFYGVTPRYFQTLKTPLIAGRDFSATESSSDTWVSTIVNEAFVKKYFPGENALGKVFDHSSNDKRIHHRIVGISADTHYSDLHTPATPLVYVPFDGDMRFTMYVRSHLSAGSLGRLADTETRELGHGLRVTNIIQLQTLVGESILKEKLLAGVGGVFALLGLGLAAIGLFGLLNYSVTRRTKEIGIRGALGASGGQITLLVLRELVVLLGGGLSAGVVLACFLSILVKPLFFGVAPIDVSVFLTAMGLFFATAIIAASIPAVHAASVDPLIALRQE